MKLLFAAVLAGLLLLVLGVAYALRRVARLLESTRNDGPVSLGDRAPTMPMIDPDGFGERTRAPASTEPPAAKIKAGSSTEPKG
jgi:hypothetical protein